MVQQSDFPLLLPFGVGIEVVDDNDPVLNPRPLVIVAPPFESKRIYKKYSDYRIWHGIVAGLGDVETSSINEGIVNDIQALYQANDGEDGFINGVEAVIAFYPASFEPSVRMSLAALPDALPIVANFSARGGLLNYVGSKAIHVESRGKTKSLPIFEQRLDVETPTPGVFFCLHNPTNPATVIAIPRDREPMRLSINPGAAKEGHDVSERTAWEHVKTWLRNNSLPVGGETQYPQGENSYPDFRASINGQEYDIEITSVPDMERWTIKSTYRDLEKKISEVAAQPGETKESVTHDLKRVLANKAKRVLESTKEGEGRRAMLVVSSWSARDLSVEMVSADDLSIFDVVMAIEHGEFVHCLKGDGLGR